MIPQLRRTSLMSAATLLCLWSVAQTPVKIGEGSIASFPPTYKAKTTTNNSGFNATAMLSRKIYADEITSGYDGALNVPGRALPTNDWWTDLINSRYSGALWSYPAMLSTSAEGVKISYPSYWADQGKEMKSRSSVSVGGYRFSADAAIATDWGDWNVVFRMSSADEKSEMKVTAAHGMPFTWFEFRKVTPMVSFSSTPTLFDATEKYVGVKIGDDLYGIYFPRGAEYKIVEGKLVFDAPQKWISVALLRDEKELGNFDLYSVSVPRSTRVDWSYDETSGKVKSIWKVEAENLRNIDGKAPVLQGFLPHAYKYALAGANLMFIDNEGYKTPRGKMKIAESQSGEFSFSYQFSGMLPIFGAPVEGEGYSQEVMDYLMANYSKNGTFGSDTYWGGKGLTQMAMNMEFAKLTGNSEVYEQSKSKLRDVMENWLTYTPGEDSYFFSYYPRWGAMLGFDVSYDSDAFNDHHFHYGYFTYAAALLCLEDPDFAEKYGEILTLIAKDYANWDREDGRFPFLRTLDPWNGHSWAGGLGDHGNDNGNGQESTSEAMQGWGGLYLLGVALDNKEMRDAGIWGWSTEARATREYWYDIDAPRSENTGGRKAWTGKNDRQGNYDYSEYPYAYNSNITGKGIGWWTWFGGDPLYMHGIQWMPISPALDYLSWDTDFVAWALDDMLSGANSAFSHDWFKASTNKDDGATIEPLAYNDWGNVALSYMQRCDPRGAAEIFDQAYKQKLHIATAVSTGHISYYTIHSHLTYGDPAFSIHADIPTAQATVKNGVYTYMVYNPDEEDRYVNFYNENGGKVKTVKAPGRRFAAISADPVASGIGYSIEGGLMHYPGENIQITAKVTDQYGAGVDGQKVTAALSDKAPASLEGSTLKIDSDACPGMQFEVVFTSENFSERATITIEEPAIANEGKDMPVLREIASKASVIASSAENVGTLPGGINDGDSSTRWGSAHNDDEWVVLDFGEDYYINDVTIDWEAAYASEYALEVAHDKCGMQTITVVYAGNRQQVSVPVEDSWTEAAVQTVSKSGNQTTQVKATGRYLRMKGLRRATQYGYSIYEMKATGVKLSSAPEDVVGLIFQLPETADRGEKVALSVSACTFGGEMIENVKVAWSSDKDAEFSGNDFTPKEAGKYTLTARLEDGFEATTGIFVNDVESPAYVLYDKDEYFGVENEGVEVKFTVMNQFMAPYTGSWQSLHIFVEDSEGNEAKDASYNPESMIFEATQCGEYYVRVEDLGSCKVVVKPLAEVNLALGRPVTVSSANGGNTGGMATDGNTGTRWESEWTDNQTITVELDGKYLIDRVTIIWEGAFARKYNVCVSNDMENWNEVYREGNSDGGTDNIEFPATEARFVRINCEERALELYGFSIWEFEVFGISKIQEPNEDSPDYEEQWPEEELPAEEMKDPETPDDSNDENGDSEDDENGSVAEIFATGNSRDGYYTLQGIKIERPATRGIYIRIENGITKKIVIP